MPCTVLVSAECGRPPMCSHSFDTAGGVDFRVVRKPPSSSPTSLRPIHRWDENDLPRDELSAPALGHIPNVETTMGYWEAASGIANHAGVMIAESTCSSIFRADLIGPDGGKALLCYQELTRIALERCDTARKAVLLMGELAVQHGFSGNVGASLGGSAESLAVVDSNEAWVFHVMPDDSGASAIWAAQRVPEGHAAVIANMFIIREVDLSDAEGPCKEFMMSRTAQDVALRLGLWQPGSPFDFAGRQLPD